MAEKSEGQDLLEQLLAARTRLRGAVAKLEQVTSAQIGPTRGEQGHGEISGASAPVSVTTFFDGLRVLAAEFDKVGAELEKRVDDLAARF